MFVALAVVALAAIAFLISRGDALWSSRADGNGIAWDPSLSMPDAMPTESIPGASEPEPKIPSVPPDVEELNDDALESAAKYAGEHGSTALIVRRHGHLVFERYWQGQSYETLANSGTFSRVVTALATGIAISERKIAAPDAPVSWYIKEWENDARGEITIQELLQSSSGLAASPVEFPVPGAQLTKDYLQLQIERYPGETWVPGGVDTRILGVVIERATGMRFAQYVSERLWKPIGAGDARIILDSTNGDARADCCLAARHGDWMRLAELLVNDGVYQGTEVVPRQWITQMVTPAKGNPEFGFQVEIGSAKATRQDGPEPYVTDGVFVLNGGGTGHRLWVIPSLGIAILRAGADTTQQQGWVESRIPNLIIRGARDFVRKNVSTKDISAIVPGH